MISAQFRIFCVALAETLLLFFTAATIFEIIHPSGLNLLCVLFVLVLCLTNVTFLTFELVSLLGVRWPLAQKWHKIFHHETHSALLAPFAALMIGASVAVDLTAGGGLFSKVLENVSHVPLIGGLVAKLLFSLCLAGWLGFLGYVVYNGYGAVGSLRALLREGHLETNGESRTWEMKGVASA